jgi:hypothetical protein
MPKRDEPEYVRPTPEQIEAAEQQLEVEQRIIEYDTKEFTIELLVQKFGAGEEDDDIFVPPYQREFSWDPWRQSRFMESVLMGLPIPFLFFGDKRDGRLEVVDGSQRLRTCRAFLTEALVLRGCERLHKLDGFRFSDLSRPQQRRLKNRTIRAVVLSPNATEADRRDLFDRINTGFLTANPAEVRRGSLPGPVTELIITLAAEPTFEKLCPMSEQSKKLRVREELVTRFFTFSKHFGSDLPGYKDRVREYLDTWQEDANKRATENEKVVQELGDHFHRVMEFVGLHFPSGFAKGPKSTFTPNVRFDAISVGVAEALRKNPKLKPKVSPTVWLSSDEFFELTTSNAANVRSKIVARIAFVRDRLLGV